MRLKHMLVMVAGLLLGLASALAFAIDPGESFGSGYFGRASYTGDYLGEATTNTKRPKTVRLAGTSVINLEFADGQITGTVTLSPLLKVKRVTGTVQDGLCVILLEGDSEPIRARCGKNGFTVSVPLDGGMNGEITVNAAVKSVEAYLVSSPTAPRVSDAIDKNTILPGMPTLRWGDTVPKTLQRVGGIAWRQSRDVLFYASPNRDSAIYSGTVKTETSLYFRGPGETLSYLHADYSFAKPEDRDVLFQKVIAQQTFMFNTPQGDVYCAKDYSRYLVVDRNQFLSSKEAPAHRLQIYSGADCGVYDRLSVDTRAPDITRNTKYNAPTTQAIRAGCLLRDKNSLTMAFTPIYQVDPESGKVLGGYSQIGFGTEDVSGNICFKPITVSCTKPISHTTIGYQGSIKCDGQTHVE